MTTVKLKPKMNPKTIENPLYQNFLSEIKERIRAAQYEALKSINKELLGLYWDIGKGIVERQKIEGWGKSIIERLAKDLQGSYPGIKGFSARNIWYMRNLYLEYHENEKLQTLSAEISWSHNLAILEQCKDNLQRQFYMKMSRRMGWSHNVLIHHIENQTYEKTIINQTNFGKTLPEPLKYQAKLAVKDDYTFDFVELNDEHTERELEKELLKKIEHFLREMGGAFSFVGSQYRVEVEDSEYFIDILLYNRYLKALVAIELKNTKFKPEYVGKMQFYLRALDQRVRLEGENYPIGIILCKSKNKTEVEYTLHDSNSPIGVAEYKLYKQLPKDLQKQLPAPDLIATLLDDIESDKPKQSNQNNP